MQQINCYIPIKLRITGRPTDAQLIQLSEELVRALSARISFAERTINNGQPMSRTSMAEEAREIIDEPRLHGESYEIPAYDDGGQREQVFRRQGYRTIQERPSCALHAAFEGEGRVR